MAADTMNMETELVSVRCEWLDLEMKNFGRGSWH